MTTFVAVFPKNNPSSIIAKDYLRGYCEALILTPAERFIEFMRPL